MTSQLDYIPPGSIWDGVTVYINGLVSIEEGPFPVLLRMLGDKTRRFSEWRGAGHLPMTELRYVTEQLGWETVGITYDNTLDFVGVHGYDMTFLGYDGTLGLEAVNQFYLLNQYRAHAARYAHQLDAALGHHSLQGASEEDRLVVFQSLSAMIGVAAMKYEEWSEVDPEALIVGGNFDGTLEWKRFLTYYEGVDANLCGQCDIATFARRFLFHADLPAFRRLYRQGIIYSADRTTDPWSPAIFDAATPPADEYFDKLDEYYHLMLEYYDNEVGLSN